jgi:hypothetical protein
MSGKDTFRRMTRRVRDARLFGLRFCIGWRLPRSPYRIMKVFEE